MYRAPSSLTWTECAWWFEWDGSLRDLYVRGATRAGWNQFLAALPEWGFPVRWSDDDGITGSRYSTVDDLFRDPPQPRGPEEPRRVPMMFVDMDPREFRGPAELAALVDFMGRLAKATELPVRLTPENAVDRPLVIVRPSGSCELFGPY